MDHKNINYWKDKFEGYLEDNPSDDGSHDLTHFKRVWNLAKKLSSENEDLLVILAACYFHDIVNYPKDDPRRSMSSKDSASKATEILLSFKFDKEKIPLVAHCI